MLAQRITAVLRAESDRLDHLVLAADLNPAADLRFGNWRGFDLTGADLRGFNFTGARFDNARIAGAVFDRAIYDLPSLRKAADFDEFLKREIGRSSARRPALVGRRLGPCKSKWQRQLRRRQDQPRRLLRGQSMGALRHDRQCRGMVRRSILQQHIDAAG